jgi:hypothetical protein
MITGIFVLPQALSSATLILFFLRFPLEALTYLTCSSVTYSFFSFRGPIARISLSVLDLAA